MDKSFLRPSNIGGISYDIYDKSRYNNVTVYCANTGVKEHIAATLEKKALYITADSLQAKLLAEDLKEYGLNADYLPEKEEILFSQYSYNKDNLYKRIEILSKLAEESIDILVASPLAVLQQVPRKQEVARRIFSIKTEQIISPLKLTEGLVEAGYKRVSTVGEIGEFSLKGDVMDIFAVGEEYPVRISFFDELIESVKSYELVSVKPIKVLNELRILPLSDILFSEKGLLKTLKKLDELVTDNKCAEAAENIRNKLRTNPTDYTCSWACPLVKDEFVSIFEYISDRYNIVFDDVSRVKEKLELYNLEHRNRVGSMIEMNQAVAEHKNSLLNLNTLLYKLNSYFKLGFMPLQSQNTLFESNFIFKITSKPPIKYYLEPSTLVSDINANRKLNNLMILCSDNIDRARALQSSLRESDVYVDIVDEIPSKKGVYLVPLSIRKSVIYPLQKLYVIGTEDLLGKKSQVKRKLKKNVAVIKEGDYVVHEKHGIGLCEGVKREKINGVEKDYIVVGYKDNAKLYISIEQMDLLTKYSGDTPKINKIGGREFEKVKKKVKASIRKMAFDLVELYRKREQANGYKYSADTVWQKEFEDEFEFTETQDQLQAIGDVKKDMESGKVMDRLICGDVGYGKTEVAFRAIFKTVIESKQAILLAPTTILANQHYNNLKKRLEPFKIGVRLLSRLQSESENKKTLEELASGKLEIVIATHRILSKDVAVKDLGLLVLDEEQRFGVEQKEKIKFLAKNVNVLTLSATPIPRTLHMAICGIRDINLLETPPVNRLPIETYIAEYDDSIVVDAVNRELARSGQVFVLYNYVETIEDYAGHLRNILGENVRITVAHGQMSAEKLEKHIDDFYNKRSDVLVCTTIIENGIDLPNANTLIVYDADKFGLGQLHQLRGRVGRSGKLAHAYFTTRKNKLLTNEAGQRLIALSEYTEFGSGFQIALKDLQIRGAGNVLGREQHGHMEQVGYELYTKLLREAVEEITTGRIEEEINTELKVDADAYADDKVIPQEDRMAFYKKVADIKTPDDAAALKNEILSMYFKTSNSIENLIDLSLIKKLASNIGVKTVIINKNRMGIEFGNVNVFKNPQIIKAVSGFKKECVLTDSIPVRVIFDAKNKSEREKILLLVKFLLNCN